MDENGAVDDGKGTFAGNGTDDGIRINASFSLFSTSSFFFSAAINSSAKHPSRSLNCITTFSLFTSRSHNKRTSRPFNSLPSPTIPRNRSNIREAESPRRFDGSGREFSSRWKLVIRRWQSSSNSRYRRSLSRHMKGSDLEGEASSPFSRNDLTTSSIICTESLMRVSNNPRFRVAVSSNAEPSYVQMLDLVLPYVAKTREMRRAPFHPRWECRQHQQPCSWMR